MVEDITFGIITKPDRENINLLKSDINSIYKNRYLIGLVNSLPFAILLLNKFRQVLFLNKVLIELLSEKKISLGLRPGELLGCVHCQDSVKGCGESYQCRYCNAVKTIRESVLKKKQITNEVKIYTDLNDLDNVYEFIITSAPFTYNNLDLIVVSLEDIRSRNKIDSINNLFLKQLLEKSSNLESILENNLSISKSNDMPISNSWQLCHEIVSELIDQQIYFKALENTLETNSDSISSTDLLKACQPPSLEEQFTIDIKSESFKFKSDCLLLSRVLNNTIKFIFNKANSALTEISLGCFQLSENIVFHINSSVELPKPSQKQIFKHPYTLVNKIKDITPLGIKTVVEQYLNGSIWLESNRKIGTTIFIRLPKKQI
jgi:ribosomal protein L31E